KEKMATTIQRRTLERINFIGRVLVITVTRSASVISRWIRTVHYFNLSSRHPLVVGVGVQWTPFRYYRDPLPDVPTLCVGNRCLIIQLKHCNRTFLADRGITFLGIWNSQDKGKLERCSHRVEIWRLLDVRLYLSARLRNCSFEKIVNEYLEKKISTSDWGVRILSNNQIFQASEDSYVSFKLGVKQRLWEV
ncbi:unnamed protein product, partial [Thlaspi arvense]